MTSPWLSSSEPRRRDVQPPRPETVAALAEIEDVHTLAELKATKGYRSANQGTRP